MAELTGEEQYKIDTLYPYPHHACNRSNRDKGVINPGLRIRDKKVRVKTVMDHPEGGIYLRKEVFVSLQWVVSSVMIPVIAFNQRAVNREQSFAEPERPPDKSPHHRLPQAAVIKGGEGDAVCTPGNDIDWRSGDLSKKRRQKRPVPSEHDKNGL